MTRRKIHDTLTVGELAKLCNVCPRTIALWCDKGLIAYHRMPSTRMRRILVSEAKAFMTKQGLPLYKLLSVYPNAKSIVYYASLDVALLKELTELSPMVQFVQTTSLCALGMAYASAPSTVILDLALGRMDCLLATKCFSEKLVLIANEDEQDYKALKLITPSVLQRPFSASYLVELL